MNIKNNFLPIAFLVALTTALPFFASANAVLRAANTISINNDQLIDGNFYSVGQTVQISGEITNDALIAAGSVTINGKIDKDASLLGANVDVHGKVGDDLRIAGGEIIIAESVAGDVVAFGNSITILSTATIGGDLIVFGGDVEIDGSVAGDVFGNIASLRIDAPVGGNIDVTTPSLSLGDGSNVTGDIRYVSNTLVNRSPNAVVGGKVIKNDPAQTESQSFDFRSFVFPVLIVLFSLLVWHLVSRKTLHKIILKSYNPGPRPVVLGVFITLLAPFAITILLVSTLGLFVGLALLFFYLLLLVLGLVAGVAMMGAMVQRFFDKIPAQPQYSAHLIGSVLFGVCLFVPVFGTAVIVGFSVVGTGIIADLLLRANPR